MLLVSQDVLDVRSFLQQELMRRIKSNPSYSLRAFATAMGFEPSVLSKLVNGKRAITKNSFSKIHKYFELDHRITFEQTRTSDKYKQINLERFKVMADWYHFALLELIKVKHFQPKVSWIARKLEVEQHLIKLAVDRLLLLGLLEIN